MAWIMGLGDCQGPWGLRWDFDLTERRQVRRGLIHQSLEGAGLVRGEIGEDLAVDLDARLGEPADKSAVGDAVFAAAGVDALNPKRAEVTLLLLAADVVVLQRAIDGGVGRRDRVLAAAVKALGGLEDLLAAGGAGGGTGGKGKWFRTPPRKASSA